MAYGVLPLEFYFNVVLSDFCVPYGLVSERPVSCCSGMSAVIARQSFRNRVGGTLWR